MKTRMSFKDVHGTEPIVSNADGIELVKLLNWYYQTASDDDRATWLQSYAEKVLGFNKKQLKYLSLNINNISNTTSSLARAIQVGSTFVESDRVKSLIKNDCNNAVRFAVKTSKNSSERLVMSKLKSDILDDQMASDVYWSLEDQVDAVAEGAKIKHPNTSVLDNTKIDAKTIGKIKGVFLQQLTEFRVAQHDPEGYEELQPKAAFKFIGMIIEALDRNMFANRKTRKAIRKIRTSKPDKVVSKVKCLQEFSGMKSVPPINILSAKTLYAYDIKTRMLIRASTDSNHLSVKGSRIVGSVVKKKLRKPDEVLDLVRHSTERRIERMWDELTTKSSPHSGLLNPHCLIVRALI